MTGYGTYIFVVAGTIVLILGSKFEIPMATEFAIALYGMAGIRLRQAVGRKED